MVIILNKKIELTTVLTTILCIALAIISVLIFIIPIHNSKKEDPTPTRNESHEIILAPQEPIPDVDVKTTMEIETTTKVETTTCAQEIITQQKTPEKKTEKSTVATQPTLNNEKLKNNSPFYLSNDERRIVECIVMGESSGEPYEGQVLVAQCILNACLKEGLQPSDIRREYQYYGWENSPSNSVKKAVRVVFDEGYKIVNEPILYFYSPKYCDGSWHETQRFVIEKGGHRFFAAW